MNMAGINYRRDEEGMRHLKVKEPEKAEEKVGMTYEEIYIKVMGHAPNKEHGVQGAFTWKDIESLMQEAVKNNAVLLVSSICEWCGAKKENHNGLCTECGRFPSPSNFRSYWIK